MSVSLSSQSMPFDFESELSSLQPELRYFVLSLTGSVHDADEVIQEANAVALRKAGEFTPGTNLKAWLYTIASFQAKAFHRKLSRKRGYEIVDDDLLDSIIAETELDHGDEHESEKAALRECLGHLKTDQRDLILSRYLHGRKVTELAVEQNREANAIAQKLFRIRQKLAKCIQSKLSR